MRKPSLRLILCYCLGVFILALGVSVSIKSALGVSPNSSVPYTVSLITGLDNGLCQTLVFISFVLVQLAILRRDFKPVQWLQVVTSVLFGFFVTLSSNLIAFVPTPESFALRLLMSLLGAFLVGTGIFLYLPTGIVPMSAEGLVTAIAGKVNKSVPNVKLVVDCVMVLISCTLSLVFLGGLRSIGLGTVLAALLCSRFLALHMKLYGEKYKGFLHGAAPVAEVAAE